MQSVPVNYSQRGDRSHDKHLADRMRDLLYLMERFGCGAAALQNSGLHFLIARSIDLQIIRGVIRASSGIASLHSLHKPKGLLLWSFFLAKACNTQLPFDRHVCGFIPVVMEIYGEEGTPDIDRKVKRGQCALLELRKTCHTMCDQ